MRPPRSRLRCIGGDHEGENAQITVTLTAVKERELPEADDDFAQIASEFDTIDELEDSLREQVERSKTFGQGAEARDQLVEKLLELVEMPVPAQLVEDEVHRHLESENRLEDDVHRAEVTESSEKTFRTQILLDEIAQAEDVKVSQDELTQYLIQGAAQYGMDPNEFVQVLSENGQIPSMVGEVARNKALAIVLGKADVTDTNGNNVDLSEFTAVDDDEEDGENVFDEVVETAERRREPRPRRPPKRLRPRSREEGRAKKKAAARRSSRTPKAGQRIDSRPSAYPRHAAVTRRSRDRDDGSDRTTEGSDDDWNDGSTPCGRGGRRSSDDDVVARDRRARRRAAGGRRRAPLFEAAGARDYAGREAEAEPLYRRALAARPRRAAPPAGRHPAGEHAPQPRPGRRERRACCESELRRASGPSDCADAARAFLALALATPGNARGRSRRAQRTRTAPAAYGRSVVGLRADDLSAADASAAPICPRRTGRMPCAAPIDSFTKRQRKWSDTWPNRHATQCF